MRNRNMMYWGQNGPGGRRRRTKTHGNSAAFMILFWVISACIMLLVLRGGPSGFVETQNGNLGKLYIGNVFPSVSRSSDYEAREAMGTTLVEKEQPSKLILDQKQSEGLLKSMVGLMFPGAEVLDDDLAEEDPGIVFQTEDTENGAGAAADAASEPSDTVDSEKQGAVTPIDSSKPLVIIYHTHATESYQPVDEGNFHSLQETGTVRAVGDILEKELKSKGIQVIHDKTLHDSPSYNQSYTRSLETVKRLMESSPVPAVVIDLHRDAAAYSGNTPKTVKIGKKEVAQYSLVIGTGNPNYEALKQFAGSINQKAEEMYPGFGGKIIEKQYKFNQYVSDHHILLEIGNNQNTIDQAKLTGKYFADVLAAVIADME